MRRLRGSSPVIATAVLGGLLLAGCGGGDGGAATASDPGSGPASTGPATAEPGSPTVDPPGSANPSRTAGPEAPELLRFDAKTVDGQAFDGRSLAGKPVVFWFWAPWCPKCASEAPNLAALDDEFGDRVHFVGIASLDTVPAMQQFIADRNVGGFVQLNDEDGAVWRRFEVTVQSTLVFMKGDGSTSRVEYAVLGHDELRDRVRELVAG